MPEPQIILDYASPRKRSQFRLASASLLESKWMDRTLVIREWLAGQGGAVVAIGASFLMVANLAAMTLYEVNVRVHPVEVIICWSCVALWLALLPAVIQQTWRETVLRIGEDGMHLTMGGPFSRRRYVRLFDQIQSIRVIPTQSQEGAPLLAEIEILADNAPPIRLFTDHTQPKLAQLASEIEQAVKGTPPALAANAPNSTVEALRRVRE
jgi:hypothetical protein